MREKEKKGQMFSSVEEMMACTPKPQPWNLPPISETTASKLTIPRTDYIQELQKMGLNEAWVDEIDVADDGVIVTAKPDHCTILRESFKGKSMSLDKRVVICVRIWDGLISPSAQMELPLPEELEAQRKKIEENLHPIRGHIQTVRPPQSHPGNTKATGELDCLHTLSNRHGSDSPLQQIRK